MPPNSDPHPEYSTGILASQTIKNMIASGKVISETDILEKQIQPASIDLRLSGVAYRVQASFLPTKCYGSRKTKDYGDASNRPI